MKIRGALLGAVSAVALSSSADAARLTSWYGVFEGGVNQVQDFEISQFATPAPAPVLSTLTMDYGWAAMASVGYAYNNGWRMEMEAGYRQNDMNEQIPAVGLPVIVSGDLSQYTLMANVLYDFPSTSGVTLSVGAGVGANYGRIDANSLTPAVQGDDISLAFQGIVGLSTQLTSWLDLVMNYRFLYTTQFDFADDAVLAPPNVAHIALDNLQQHTLTMGFRWGGHKSEAPQVIKSAPPPPPPPQAQIARQYVIYFGFNKCNITADADMVLSEAANASRSLGAVAVKIVGHTDTVGSRQANQRLSDCRAKATKSNLVSKGVPSGTIQAYGVGEGQLLVNTPDNVKEPQNRRATIDLD